MLYDNIAYIVIPYDSITYWDRSKFTQRDQQAPGTLLNKKVKNLKPGRAKVRKPSYKHVDAYFKYIELYSC